MAEEKHKLPLRSVRLEALGDGIFSVAMTLLVIELKMPTIQGGTWQSFSQAVHTASHDFLCYVISFIILGIMWFGHRMMFEYIGKTNRYFIFLGVLFYMMVCLVPFSTSFLADNTFQWYAILCYGCNLSLCNLTLYAQWSYGIKRKALLERELVDEVRKEARILFLISPVVYTIAIIISFWLPQVSIGIFVITPVLYLLPNKLDKYLP
ncbi:MAG: TMEM175 family protein [Parafilimonas sp.]